MESLSKFLFSSTPPIFAVDRIGNSGVAVDDIVHGNRDKTLALLWTFIFTYKLSSVIDKEALRAEIRIVRRLSMKSVECFVQDVDVPSIPSVLRETGCQEEILVLLGWCRAICGLYGKRIVDFCHSFADGAALCLLIHYYYPR